MAGKDKKSKSGKERDSKAKGADSTDDDGVEEFEPTNRLRFVGLGLIGSVVIGYSPLRDAIQGNGPFENAMFRFLACLVTCIFAASIVGRMLDGAPAANLDEEGVKEANPGTGTTKLADAGGAKT